MPHRFATTARSLVRLTFVAAALVLLAGFSRCDDPGAARWATWGGDLHNTHFAHGETAIDVTNVSHLQVKWVFHAKGDVSAIPTVSDRLVYVTDWGPLGLGGWIHAIDRETGASVASKPVIEFTLNALDDGSRSSPAIDGDRLIFGDMRSQPTAAIGILPGASGASLYAVSRTTGALLWRTILDPHPLAVVTQSPVVYGGRVYVGVSSLEETASKLVYPCCSFQGSMLALDAATGQIRWRTPMLPTNGGAPGGFSGAAVWGSAPAIDEQRRVVYVGTGNLYSTPSDLAACIAQYRGDAQAQQTQCYDELDPPDDYAESILALDLDTGAVRWARKLHNYGAWNFACDPALVPWAPTNTANCFDLDSLDYDFGQAPMLLTTKAGRDLVVAGQKSGVFWAFDPDQGGATVWARAVAPGGELGGMEFGAATDGERIYTQSTNFSHLSFPLVAGAHAGETVNGGIWAALDAATGTILWETPDPLSSLPLTGSIAHPAWGPGLGEGFFAVDMGPLTVSNGVVFAGSMDRQGHMYAMNAATGEILWSFASGASVASAPSIVDGVLYWGSGYHEGSEGNAVYAFGLP
jgi:polyvinyl alcohol dehydrogenase (cytochrome)